MELAEYIESKSKEAKNLGKNLRFLKGITIPLQLAVTSNNEFMLFSRDYSLATDFEFKSWRRNNSGRGAYDRGYSERYDFYPQFFFNLKRDRKNFPVLVQHPDFYEDERVILRSYTSTNECEQYLDQNVRIEHYIDIKEVFAFFEEQGVEKSLLDKLKKKIESPWEALK
jgi:hypothetical protein